MEKTCSLSNAVFFHWNLYSEPCGSHKCIECVSARCILWKQEVLWVTMLSLHTWKAVIGMPPWLACRRKFWFSGQKWCNFRAFWSEVFKQDKFSSDTSKTLRIFWLFTIFNPNFLTFTDFFWPDAIFWLFLTFTDFFWPAPTLPGAGMDPILIIYF